MRDPAQALKALQNTPEEYWPEGAAETIHSALRDPDLPLDQRQSAVGLASSLCVMNDEIAEALLDIIRAPHLPAALRGGAAIALGPVLEQTDLDLLPEDDSFDDDDELACISRATFHRIQSSLRELYQDPATPKDVRRPILEAAVRAREEWQVDAVRQAWESGDDQWMLTAVFCMQFIEGFEQEVLQSLHSPHPEVRVHAVRAAGNWGISQAWPVVHSLLQDRRVERPLLLAAIEAAGEICPEEARSILIHLGGSPDEEIAEAAQDAAAVSNILDFEADDEAGLDEDDDDDIDELDDDDPEEDDDAEDDDPDDFDDLEEEDEDDDLDDPGDDDGDDGLEDPEDDDEDDDLDDLEDDDGDDDLDDLEDDDGDDDLDDPEDDDGDDDLGGDDDDDRDPDGHRRG